MDDSVFLIAILQRYEKNGIAKWETATYMESVENLLNMHMRCNVFIIDLLMPVIKR